ncbi:MAG: 30S ribosomal protein S4 [Candidatus Cloacimonetes bacterium]|nr:30S ribosomal protein S4 [Candidatus Cloacimonadota bacterium]
MARYTGPKAKICRRFGENIMGSPKYDKILEKRNYRPGQHGQAMRRKVSDYSIHLTEKQKLRYTYGVLERQFRNYFQKADKMQGKTGDNLLELLERRLDNIVYRMGFARTRMQARQFINHGHFIVNGRKVNIPSFIVNIDDVVVVKDKSKKLSIIQEAIDANRGSQYEWLEVNSDEFTGKVLQIPTREQIPIIIDERLIVEYYSK